MPSALATTASSGFTWGRRRKKGGVREGAQVPRPAAAGVFSFGPPLFSLSFSYLVERFKHDAGHLVRSRLDADAAPGGRGGGPGGGAGGGKGRGQAEDELVSELKEKKIFETQEIGRGAGEGGGDWGKRGALRRAVDLCHRPWRGGRGGRGGVGRGGGGRGGRDRASSIAGAESPCWCPLAHPTRRPLFNQNPRTGPGARWAGGEPAAWWSRCGHEVGGERERRRRREEVVGVQEGEGGRGHSLDLDLFLLSLFC